MVKCKRGLSTFHRFIIASGQAWCLLALAIWIDTIAGFFSIGLFPSTLMGDGTGWEIQRMYRHPESCVHLDTSWGLVPAFWHGPPLAGLHCTDIVMHCYTYRYTCIDV